MAAASHVEGVLWCNLPPFGTAAAKRAACVASEHPWVAADDERPHAAPPMVTHFKRQRLQHHLDVPAMGDEITPKMRRSVSEVAEDDEYMVEGLVSSSSVA